MCLYIVRLLLKEAGLGSRVLTEDIVMVATKSCMQSRHTS